MLSNPFTGWHGKTKDMQIDSWSAIEYNTTWHNSDSWWLIDSEPCSHLWSGFGGMSLADSIEQFHIIWPFRSVTSHHSAFFITTAAKMLPDEISFTRIKTEDKTRAVDSLIPIRSHLRMSTLISYRKKFQDGKSLWILRAGSRIAIEFHLRGDTWESERRFFLSMTHTQRSLSQRRDRKKLNYSHFQFSSQQWDFELLIMEMSFHPVIGRHSKVNLNRTFNFFDIIRDSATFLQWPVNRIS